MNTFLQTLLNVALIATIICLFSCSSEKQTTVISFVKDQSESYFEKSDPKKILKYSTVKRSNSLGEIIRIQPMNEFTLNPIFQSEVEPVAGFLQDNEFERGKAIKEHHKRVQEELSVIDTGIKDRVKTEVYRTLAKEVNILAALDVSRKILLVESDFKENSSLGNFHRPSTLRELSDNPEAYREKFNKALPIQNLSGIEVYLFIEQPSSITENSEMEITSNFFADLLRDKGAKVHIIVGSVSLPEQLAEWKR